MTSVLLGISNSDHTGDQELLTSRTKTNGGEEEQRAFLTFSSGGGAEESDGEQGQCPKRRRVMPGGQIGVLAIVLLVLLGSLAVAITCLELYHRREVDRLQNDLTALKKDVESLKHRVQEQDLLNELRAFEDAVYAEEEASEGHDGGEDEEDDGEDEEDNNGDDVDYYTDEEEEPEPVDEKRRGKFHEKYEEILASRGQLHKAARTKREILSASDSSVPVISASYSAVHNKTTLNSEGLRLYESLVAGGGKGEPQEVTEDPIKDYHRQSPVWPAKHHKKHKHEGPQPLELPHPYHRRRSTYSSTQAPASIISRQSRVMETDTDSSRRFPSTNNRIRYHTAPKQATVSPPVSLPDDGMVVRVQQEGWAPAQPSVRSSDFHSVKRVRNVKKKNLAKKNLANQELDETVPTQPNGRRRLMPAIHFSGDTSKYSLGHDHYAGNGRLRHPEGLFVDWAASSWVQEMGMQRHFNLTRGELEIQDGGLYFVYAQIHYLDEHDTNGYRVLVNNMTMLQCTVMTHDESNPYVLKSNSCYTAGILYLEAGDKLSIRDIGSLRFSIFEPAKSFFGLFKLGRGKIREHK